MERKLLMRGLDLIIPVDRKNSINMSTIWRKSTMIKEDKEMA